MPKLPEQLLQAGLLQPAKSWVVAADRGGPRRSAVTAGRLGHMHACQRVTCMSNWAEMASHNSTYAASIHNSVMQPVMLYGCCSLSAAVAAWELLFSCCSRLAILQWGMMAGEPKLQLKTAK